MTLLNTFGKAIDRFNDWYDRQTDNGPVDPAPLRARFDAVQAHRQNCAELEAYKATAIEQAQDYYFSTHKAPMILAAFLLAAHDKKERKDALRALKCCGANEIRHADNRLEIVEQSLSRPVLKNKVAQSGYNTLDRTEATLKNYEKVYHTNLAILRGDPLPPENLP